MIEPRLLRAEELRIGDTINLGNYLVSHDEIVAFAKHWDPQPFHIDDAAAAEGRFGEVIASGMHTLSIFQRLAVLGAYRHWDIVAGRAIRDVQLTSPVRPNTLLAATLRVDRVELTHPDRALVSKHGTISHGDNVLLTVDFDSYVRRVPS